MIRSSKRVLDCSRRLDLGGVSAREVALVVGRAAVVGEGVVGGLDGIFFCLVEGVIVAEGLVLAVAAAFREGVVGTE